MNSGKSWGQFPKVKTKVVEAWWRDEVSQLKEGSDSYLAVGKGRSYGDSALLSAERGAMVSLCRCQGLLSFDADTALLTVEGGCSLSDILAWSVPRKYFLPVVPGTKYVTVAGAVANDIHGKNHHEAGTFGYWVDSFKLFHSQHGWLLCSREQNRELFEATIGGLGLTGVIVEVTIKMHSLVGQGLVEQESRRFGSLDEGMQILEEMDRDFPMTVAWLDMASSKTGQGVAMGGRFVEGEMPRSSGQTVKVPVEAPHFVLNRSTIRAFNRVYSVTRREGVFRQPFHSYFFPLDGIGDWNRLYGRRGFLQYQCVVPKGKREVLACLQKIVTDSGQGACLSVLKKFGVQQSPGWLSFPMAGWTLAMDFPMEGSETLALFERMDDIVREAGGRLYPAKDARMDADFFRQSYPAWERLEQMRDPKITSEFWERMLR